MSSTSEVTFGSKLANARKLAKYLQSFTDYSPSAPGLQISDLSSLIETASGSNDMLAATQETYSRAVQNRQRVYNKDADSLLRVLAPVVATVRSYYGRTAKETTDIASMVQKIRGENIPAKKAGDTTQSISQSQRSFGSICQTFSGMITTLEKYGTGYAPSNANIKTASLRTLLLNMQMYNDQVATSYSARKQQLDDRKKNYDNLKATSQRIKDGIKSQYGVSSSEYKLVKSLVV